jgi:hypothetical protein
MDLVINVNNPRVLTNRWRRAGNAMAATAAMALVASISTPAWAITGGTDAAPGEFPSVVLISSGGHFACTGLRDPLVFRSEVQ